MSQGESPRAILDADIIYSRVLHELMGRVARDLRKLDLVWSEQLLAEATRALVHRKGLVKDVAQRWVDYLPKNFPAGRTDIEGELTSAQLDVLTSDPGDRHVCALAIASGADYLFTHDRGYLRDGLMAHGVQVADPDSFLVGVFDDQSRGMLDVLELQASTWAGGRPIEELLDAIERAGAAAFAGRVRHSLDL